MKHSPHVEAARHKLHGYLTKDKAGSLLVTLVRWCEDPLRPRTEQGKFRSNSLFVLIGVLFAFSVLTFLGFSLVRQ